MYFSRLKSYLLIRSMGSRSRTSLLKIFLVGDICPCLNLFRDIFVGKPELNLGRSQYIDFGRNVYRAYSTIFTLSSIERKYDYPRFSSYPRRSIVHLFGSSFSSPVLYGVMFSKLIRRLSRRFLQDVIIPMIFQGMVHVQRS